MKHKSGNLVFLGIVNFVCLFYVPGLILLPFFQDFFIEYYAVKINPYLPFLVIFFLFMVLVYVTSHIVLRVPKILIFKFNARLMYFAVLLLCLIYFIASVDFSIYQSRSFRHESRLAETSFLTRLMFLLQPILLVYVAKSAVYVSTGYRLGKKNKVLLLAVLLSMILSLNSASGMISIGLLICIIYFPWLLRMKLSDIKFNELIKFILFASAVSIFALFGGLGSKLGYSFIFSNQGFVFILDNFGFIVARISSSLYSLGAVWEQGVFNPVRDAEVVSSFQQTFNNRLSLVFDYGDFNTSMINTVNKINYDLIFGFDGSRAGASPGPLSSIIYFPYFPLGLIVIPLLYAYMARIFMFSLAEPSKVTVLGLVVAFYFVVYMFEAPLNVFYVIDPVLFGFVTILLMNYFIPERMFEI